jgi:hypothetical protein
MKNFKFTLVVAVLMTALTLNFSSAKDPAYKLSVQNLKNTSANTLEFDICLQHLNPEDSKFSYMLGQYFMNFNSEIGNGGKMTFSIIGSDLPQGSQPTNSSIDNNILRIAVNAIPSTENLPEISAKAPGTVIAKVRLSTSAKEFANVPLNLSFRTGPENPFTKVSTFEEGKIKDVTVVGTTESDNPGNGQEVTNIIPKEYALLQNYPNPFNPETSIKFDIPNAGNVKLSIFDITGKEVNVLVNENLNAGTYSFKWNGAQFASGIYFYRVSAGSFIQTRKMVLIK